MTPDLGLFFVLLRQREPNNKSEGKERTRQFRLFWILIEPSKMLVSEKVIEVSIYLDAQSRSTVGTSSPALLLKSSILFFFLFYLINNIIYSVFFYVRFVFAFFHLRNRLKLNPRFGDHLGLIKLRAHVLYISALRGGRAGIRESLRSK